MLMKNMVNILIVLGCLLAGFIACKKNNGYKPDEELVLLEKVYKDGKLYIHIFYDQQHRIHKMDYYKDNGEIKSRRTIQLDGNGRVKNVIMDFGNYVATNTITYKDGRKILQETIYEFTDGREPTYGKRVWKHLKANVIQDLLYADDLETISYTSTFTYSESGNIEKKEREVSSHPQQNTYELYEYDRGISYEFMIESNIPGYTDVPIAKNQLLNKKVFKPDGEFVTEVKLENTYDKKGYLVAYTYEYPGSKEEYRIEYKVVLK